MSYTLHYWNGIPGRGEFPRLALEYTSTPYNSTKDNSTLVPTITNPERSIPAFAPPCLELPNGKFISQTPAILSYLGKKLGLDGTDGGSSDDDEVTRAQCNQLVLTLLDLNNEVHDVHHPVDPAAYYEDQKDEAVKRAESFRARRLVKYLKPIEAAIAHNSHNKDGNGPFVISNKTSNADLVLFHMITGLEFAFPKRMKSLKESGDFNLIYKVYERVAAEPTIAAYMKSDRRQAFSMGIFRHYPELDSEN